MKTQITWQQCEEGACSVEAHVSGKVFFFLQRTALKKLWFWLMTYDWWDFKCYNVVSLSQHLQMNSEHHINDTKNNNFVLKLRLKTDGTKILWGKSSIGTNSRGLWPEEQRIWIWGTSSSKNLSLEVRNGYSDEQLSEDVVEILEANGRSFRFFF